MIFKSYKNLGYCVHAYTGTGKKPKDMQTHTLLLRVVYKDAAHHYQRQFIPKTKKNTFRLSIKMLQKNVKYNIIGKKNILIQSNEM